MLTWTYNNDHNVIGHHVPEIYEIWRKIRGFFYVFSSIVDIILMEEQRLIVHHISKNTVCSEN